MFSPNLDFELQCEWATTLAASGTANIEEIKALTKAALTCRATGMKPPSRFSNSSQNRTIDESRIRCLVPLCNFLLESNGQFADYLIPEILNRFQTLPEVFNLNPTSTSSFQKTVTECLLKFHEVMKLNSVPVSLLESMSEVVHDVLKKCIAPEEKVSAGPTTRYFFARALARDTQLEDHFPMLPKHAYSLLSWLHHHFYTLDADAHTITQISVDILSTGVVDKPVVWHLDDEKMMALTIPIVSAAFPLEERRRVGRLVEEDHEYEDKVEFSLETLTRIVSFACESVQAALDPILQSGPDRKIRLDVGPQAGMSFSIRQKAPSADLVRAASKLATRLVYRLWEYQKSGHFNVKDDFSTVKNEVSKVVDIMLQVAEICLEAAWESGAVYILGIAKHMLTETMQLVSAGVSLGDSMNDTLSRLRAFMLKSIRLVEDGGSFDVSINSSIGSNKSRGSANSPGENLFVLEWDISKSFMNQGTAPVDSPIMELCSVSSEALCMTLADGWKANQRADVRGVAIPLGNIMIASTISSSCGDRQIAALCLGRLFVLVGGDPEMARLLLPLLMDGMLGSENGTPTPVYACLLHVLATIGGVSGRCGFPWALNQVLEQMIKLYKDPYGVVSRGLMFATGHEGRQKGCMASAFLQLAKLLQTAKIGIRRQLRLKLLALFSDFGLRAFELKAVYDLGALLPAIAASCENLDEALPSMITGQTAKSLQGLESQVSDVSLIRYFRNLWMYSAIHKFSGLCHRGALEWPQQWPEALGKIAAATPALSGIDGWQKSESDQERLRPELKDRLTRVGPKADVIQLGALLRDLVAPFGNNLNTAQLESSGCAYLLAVATLELSRAALSALPGPLEAAPMSSIMSYLSVVVIHNPEAPWLRAIGEKVFVHYLRRLSGSIELGIGDKVPIKQCQSSLALTLINGLASGSSHTHEDYPQVADLANTFLEQLVKSVPSLYWNEQCLNQLLTNLDQEECTSVMIEGGDVRTGGLVWNWVLHWIDAIATMAPTRAEAIIHEYLRDDTVPENRVMLRHAPELLSRCSKAGHRQSQAEKEGARRFMRSLARKSYYIGRVSGFNDDLDQRTAPDQEIVRRVIDSLKQSVANKQFCESVEQKYLQAAATLVRCTPFSTPHDLLRAICWTPVQIFNPSMMQLATFSWEWVLTGSFSLNISMVVEIMDAWIWTINKKLGIFTGSKSEISPAALQEIDDSAQSSSIDGIKAHSLWLSFLLEQWEVSCQAPSDTLMAHTGIFARLLMHSLHHPHTLSHHPAAAGARFKLLTLGLKYCQFFADGNSDNVTAAVLYERTIRAGLSWFEYPQSWYGERTRIEGEEEVTAVKTFTELLAQWPRKSNLNGRQIAKSSKLLASVWHSKSWTQDMSDSRRDLLVHLCRREIERLQVWVCPIPHADLSAARAAFDWAKYVNTAWTVHPRLALGLINRYPKVPSIENELFSLINKNASEVVVQVLPDAGIILATSDPIKRLKASQKLEMLKHWAPASLNDAMFLLTTDTNRYPIIKAFIISSLDKANPEQLAFYLPQLIQGLRHDHDSALQYLLRHKAAQSWVFCHRLMWYLRSEFKPPPEAMNPEIKRSGWKAPSDTGLWSVTLKLHDLIRSDLDEEQRKFLDDEMGYFDKITSISGVLKPVPADERRGKIESLLRKIPLERSDLYLPTNPGSVVKSVVSDSGTPMPSKEKMPILVQFHVVVDQSSVEGTESSNEANLRKQALIFKVGDDVRQDVLALQIIKILKDVYMKAGLDLYLCPYGVIPTGYEKGVIEVVPNSKSRSALGETTDGGLYEIFQREFGSPGSKRFEAARHNFMVSEAGYAIASYLLQCKDRHNGNILIDSEGHLVHIDFGFILEISPGNNMKFENADFKLSHEMTQLLDPGGMKNSQFYHRFEEMCIRAFLAARSVAEPIITCVALMKHSGLPCFEIGHAVANLRARFHLEKTEKQVAAVIKAMVLNAYCKWTTSYYDKLQKYTY